MRHLSDNLARRVLEALPIAAVVNRGARIIAANAAARELLGARVAPGSRLALLAHLPGRGVGRIRIAGGPVRHLRAHTRPIGVAGLRVSVLYGSHAGSEDKMVDAQTQAQLQSAREVMNSQREFVRMLSHELKTPLAVIDAQMVRMHKRLDGNSDLLVYVTRTQKAVTSMLDQLKSSLSAERLAPESFELTRRPQNLADMVMRAADRIAAGEEDETRVRIDVAVTQDAPEIPIDAARINQVLNNLLENAIKYSPDGPRVTVVHRRRAGWQEVQVRDQGIGLPAGSDQGLYDKFARGANTRNIPGTGIGLHLARLIVEQHGGTVQLSPNAPQGTVATLRLPETDSRR